MTEQEAIKQLKRGEIAGLRVLVERHQLRAVRTAMLITRERGLAEEVVQAAFLRVYQRIEQFDSSRPFAPWFLRIVANDALKAIRRRKREVLFSGLSANGQMPLDEVMTDTTPGPSELVAEDDLGRQVQAALNQLSPKQRIVIVMRYYLDMSGQEMARELSISERAVKGRLTRAREQLRILLRRDEAEVE